jgi:hypothetical protein
VPVTIKKKAEVETLVAQMQQNALAVQALLAEEEPLEGPGFAPVEGDLAEAAKLADQLGALQDEVKAAKKVVKAAGELSKKIQELAEAHINGPEGSRTIQGDAFTVLIGPRVTERKITDMQKLYELMGHETFIALAAIKMGDIDKYLTKLQQQQCISSNKTGSREFKIVPKS